MKKILYMLSLSAILTASASAATVNCPTDSVCNGNIYTVTSNAVGGGVFEILVSVDTSGYTGGAPAALGAIAIKDFLNPTNSAYSIISFTATGSSSFPAPTALWTLSNKELNANGCEGGTNSSFCADAGESNPYTFNKGDTLNLAFRFSTSAILSPSMHLKYQFLEKQSNGSWTKEGDLGSFTIYRDGLIPGNENNVPEPATYALLGGSLIGLALLKRRS